MLATSGAAGGYARRRSSAVRPVADTIIGTGAGFRDWLHARMRSRRVSQRQLAARAGIHHATISRLLRGERIPSLLTAVSLARALRDEQAAAAFYGSGSDASPNPTTRIAHALRSDDALDEAAVREIMRHYLAIRREAMRRRAESAAKRLS